MIEVRDLTKNYGSFSALQGLTFQIPKGQVVGFLGPNGAGKSTTMKILTGFAEQTSGVASVAGVDVSYDPVEARRNVGYLPESNPLYEDMMVKEYLDFIADIRKIPSNNRRSRIQDVVQRCGLGDMIGKDIGHLSKGYRQRVGLAQSILHDPDLLILDEPTSGLDPNQIVEIRNLIREIGEEKTVIMSTHILSEVQNTASRVLIINEGKLVADDSPENLTSEEGGTLFLVVGPKNGTPLDQNVITHMLESLPEVSQVQQEDSPDAGALGFKVRYSGEDPRRSVFDSVVKQDLVLLELRRQHVSLEDTFRKLTVNRS
jgi:ABC-2 type transport system ATP-binding protein